MSKRNLKIVANQPKDVLTKVIACALSKLIPLKTEAAQWKKKKQTPPSVQVTHT